MFEGVWSKTRESKSNRDLACGNCPLLCTKPGWDMDYFIFNLLIK
jgi:hypothetical protein